MATNNWVGEVGRTVVCVSLAMMLGGCDELGDLSGVGITPATTTSSASAASADKELLGKWVRTAIDKGGMEVEIRTEGDGLVGAIVSPPGEAALLALTRTGSGMGDQTASNYLKALGQAWAPGQLKWKTFESAGKRRWSVQDLRNPLAFNSDGSWKPDPSGQGKYREVKLVLVDSSTLEVRAGTSKQVWRRASKDSKDLLADRYAAKSLRADKGLAVPIGGWASRLRWFATGKRDKSCPDLSEIEGKDEFEKRDARRTALAACHEKNQKAVALVKTCPATLRLPVTVSDYDFNSHAFIIEFTRADMPLVSLAGDTPRVLWDRRFLLMWPGASPGSKADYKSKKLCVGGMADTLPALAGLRLAVWMMEREAKAWKTARSKRQEESDQFRDYVEVAFVVDGKSGHAQLPCEMKTASAATGQLVAWRLVSRTDDGYQTWVDWQGVALWKAPKSCKEAGEFFGASSN